MKKREKKKLQQRTGIREHLPRLDSTSDAPVKLILIVIYLLGGILVWRNQQSIAASAGNISYISPVAVYALEHIFGTYLTVGCIFVTILIFIPLDKKNIQDQLRAIGFVNHADMVPELKRKYKDKQNPRISIWEFTARGIPLKEWKDKQAAIETVLDITIVKMKNGSGKKYTYYEARYTEGFDPGTGKQIQRSIMGKTQKEVAQKLKAATAALDAGTYKAPCKMSVGEWLDIWIAEYLNNVKPLTRQNYAKQVNKHLKPSLGATKLEALEAHTIQKFYNSLSESGLSPKTVKNIHGVLHSALQQAVENKNIKYNPTEACKLPKVVNPEIKPLEPDEIARMLQEAEKDDYCNLFIVAMFTGMRQGELLGLPWECVDFTNGIITVKQQLQCTDGLYFMETPKNGKHRTILPAPIVMDTLRKEQLKQQREKALAGEAWDNHFNLVFTDALGKNLVRRTVVKHFKKITQRAGISDDARFHDLRHSFAVTSLYAGDDIKTVQANLGHATAQFTLDTYGHVMQKMRHDSADRMQSFYEQLSK